MTRVRTLAVQEGPPDHTVLTTGGAPERGVALYAEGTRLDSLNVGLYLGLEQAMRLGRRPVCHGGDCS